MFVVHSTFSPIRHPGSSPDISEHLPFAYASMRDYQTMISRALYAWLVSYIGSTFSSPVIKRVRLISPRLSPKRRRDDGDELKTDKTDRESESTRSLDEHSTPPKKNPRRSLEPKRTKRTRLESSDEESEFQPSQDHLELSRRSLDLREKGPQVTRELRSSRKVIVPTAHPNKRRKGVRS